MTKKTSLPLISWISAVLGAVSSLILLFILWKRPTNDHEIVGSEIPKIKLPDETELNIVTSPVLKNPPKLPEETQTKTQVDDLKKIEGIGPKISQLLNEHDITTYASLAETDVDDLKNLLTEANIRIANPATWPEQAVYAVKEDWEGLKAFQQVLKGGRREE